MSIDALQVLGKTIRSIRNEQNMTQEQLAGLANMHRSFVIAVEKGRQNVSAVSLLRIAAALRVLPGELFRDFTRSTMRKFLETISEPE